MSTETASITVTGMACERYIRSVREEPTKLDGVRDVDVHLATGQVTLHSSAPVDHDAVRAAVEGAGYEVTP